MKAIKNYKLPVVRYKISRDIMDNMIIVINTDVSYMRNFKRASPKSSNHKEIFIFLFSFLFMWGDGCSLTLLW